jgi:hypothetical protein
LTGVYLRDVVFIDDGNPNYLGESKDNTVINFEKLQLLGDVLTQIRRFQQYPYQIEPNWVMREYLEKLLVLPEEMLYKHSILCEHNPGAAQQ